DALSWGCHAEEAFKGRRRFRHAQPANGFLLPVNQKSGGWIGDALSWGCHAEEAFKGRRRFRHAQPANGFLLPV
ncbi:hypothetical protein V5H32_23470, partial [Salmonella enterica]